MKTVLFDGVCIFCDWSVRFIKARDKKNVFMFSPLQSPIGRAILEINDMPTTTIDTIVLIEDKRVFIKSKAVFQILKQLDTYWKVLLIFQYLPIFLTDFFYDIFAKYRYRIFGKNDSCKRPYDDDHSSNYLME